MDAFLTHLTKHSLVPSFEFMGFPNKFIKFEKTNTFWSGLVKKLVKRYIGIVEMLINPAKKKTCSKFCI